MATIALVVEEVSPEDGISAMNRRVSRFLKAGVPLVWLVHPDERLITVFRRGKSLDVVDETEELSGENAPPGQRCLAADLLPPLGQ